MFSTLHTKHLTFDEICFPRPHCAFNGAIKNDSMNILIFENLMKKIIQFNAGQMGLKKKYKKKILLHFEKKTLFIKWTSK